MNISDADGEVTVTTTGIHVARRIGEAVSHAFKGDMVVQYPAGEHCVHVFWKR